MFVNSNTLLHECVPVCAYLCTCVCMYACLNECVPVVCISVHTHFSAYVLSCMSFYAHMCLCTYMSVCMHMWVNTYRMNTGRHTDELLECLSHSPQSPSSTLSRIQQDQLRKGE